MRRFLLAGAAALALLGPAGAEDIKYAGRVVILNPDGTIANLAAIGGGGSSVVASIVTGQVKIATTGTAVQLPAAVLVNGVVVKAATFNAANGLVGSAAVLTTYDGTGNGFPLEPGAAASFATTNTAAVWVNGKAGDVFSYEGN